MILAFLLSKLHFSPALAYGGLAGALLLEGETALIAGAFAAHRGYLELGPVMALGYFMALFSDWFYFFLGKKRGKKILAKKVKLKNRIQRIHTMIEKHRYVLFFTFRFLYGLRIIIPLTAGTSNVSAGVFMICTSISTAVWMLTYSLLGYYFGVALAANIRELEHYEIPIIIGLLLIGALIFFIRRARQKPENLLNPFDDNGR